MNLYELNAAQAALLKQIEDGSISEDDAADTLEGLDFEVNEKIEGYCRIRENMKSDLSQIENEIKRLDELKKTKKNQIKLLEQRMLNGMQASGKTKFDTGLFKGHFRKSPDSVEVVDIHDIPDEYVTTKVVQDVDKRAIKAAMQDGDVAGVKIKPGKVSLILK